MSPVAGRIIKPGAKVVCINALGTKLLEVPKRCLSNHSKDCIVPLVLFELVENTLSIEDFLGLSLEEQDSLLGWGDIDEGKDIEDQASSDDLCAIILYQVLDARQHEGDYEVKVRVANGNQPDGWFKASRFIPVNGSWR